MTASKDNIEDVISLMLDMKELFALSMQPKENEFTLDAGSEKATRVSSDKNVFDQWLNYLANNRVGINIYLHDIMREFSKELSDILETSSRKQEFALAMARLIKASFKEGTFVVPQDKNHRVAMENFLVNEPELVEFLRNTFLGNSNMQDANASLRRYINDNKIKILPKTQERTEKQKEDAKLALSKARADLIEKLKAVGRYDEHLFYKDAEKKLSDDMAPGIKDELALIMSIAHGRKEVVGKMAKEGSRDFTVLVVEHGKVNIGETYKKMLQYNADPNVMRNNKIPAEIISSWYNLYLKSAPPSLSAKKTYGAFLPTFGQRINQNINREGQLNLLQELEIRLQRYGNDPTNDKAKKLYIENLQIMLGALNFLAWELSQEHRGFFSSQSRLEQTLLAKRLEIKNILNVLAPTSSDEICNEKFSHDRENKSNDYPPVRPLYTWAGTILKQSSESSWQILEKRNEGTKVERESKKRLK